MLTEQEERVSAAMEITGVEQLKESARASGLALALDDAHSQIAFDGREYSRRDWLFKGISTRSADFSQLVASLYFVYKEMETAALTQVRMSM